MKAAEVGRRIARKRRRYGRVGVPGVATELLPVTFPSSQLTSKIWIALGADLTASRYTWNWLDITEHVRHDLGISLDVGRRDGSGRVNASRCQLKLANPDGIFTRRNPLGPYYGLLGGKTANVPIWIELDPGDGYRTMYEGYINELPTRWTDPSGSDSYVVIQCYGVLRRQELGENLDSTLNKTIMADVPVHFWRIDDPAGATSILSSMPTGGTAMTPTGIDFAELESPPGGDGQQSAARFDTGSAEVKGLAVSPPYTIEWSVLRPSDGSADGAQAFKFEYSVGGVTQSFNAAVSEDTGVTARDWYHYMAQGQQNGANYEFYAWKNGVALGLVDSGVGTLGDLDMVRPGSAASAPVSFSVGYVAVYDHLDVDAQVHSDALQAFVGERADVRFRRICAQLGITAHCQAATSALMGPQPSGTGLEVLRDLEKTDGGVLHEYGFGLGYQALSERYNAPVTFELDFDQRHIYGTPEPADDSQRFRNQWTIRSTNTGFQRTYRDPDYSTADGLLDDGDSINDNYDTNQLWIHAGHRVRRDSVDEDRWPRLPINLGGTPDLIPGWLATPLGARITVANPPPEMAPDTIDAIVEGYTQRWDTVSWVASLNTSPASIYQVGVAGDATTTGSWAQTSDAVAAEELDTTETSIDVTSTDTWTTSPAGELIRFGGEVASLTAVSGSAPNWTFTVVRSVNGVIKSHAAGTPIRVHRPAVAVY
jgi:hypothetical protein